MRFLQLQIYLLLWFQAVKGLKVVQVELGGNMTVNCDLVSSGKKYWYLQSHCRAPVPILCISCDNKGGPKYYHTVSNQAFILQANNSLLVQNITENALGDYYCVDAAKPVFSKGLRLTTTAFLRPSPEHVNKTELKDQQPPPHSAMPSLTLASAVLNCVLIVPVVALLASHWKRSSKVQPPPPDPNLQQRPDLNSTQYAQIELPTLARGPKLSQDNTVYSQAKIPK